MTLYELNRAPSQKKIYCKSSPQWPIMGWSLERVLANVANGHDDVMLKSHRPLTEGSRCPYERTTSWKQRTQYYCKT